VTDWSVAIAWIDEGGAGGDVSTVTFSAPETDPLLPAASVAWAVIACGPEGTVATIDQFPPVAVPVGPGVPSIRIVTVAPLSAVPVNVSEVRLVRLSTALVPVSLAAARSGVDGAAGGVVSTVTVPDEPLSAEELPAASTARTRYW